MPNFTAGTSFTDGVTNDVTAAKLNALVADAVPTSSLALTSTNGTIANFTSSTANITLGTIPTLTAGTTTGTAGVFTSGTITTGVIPTLTAGTTTGTAGIFTSGTITAGLIPTLTTGTTTSTNEVVTNGTITNLSATTSTFLGTITGSTNVVNIGSGQIYKDSSGNVGVGTTSPGSKLTVGSGGAIQFDRPDGTNQFRLGYTANDLALKLNFNAGSTLAVVDNSGNVGIGTASPTRQLSVSGASAALGITSTAAGGNTVSIDPATTANGNTAQIDCSGANALRFNTNSTEAIRIDSIGNVGVGTGAPSARFHAASASASVSAGLFQITATSSTSQAAVSVIKQDVLNTTNQNFVLFQVGGGTSCGKINANGANTAAFGSISDSRLKENITALPSQINNICALRPCEFDYKDGSGHQIGFIAQEMQEVYPDAIGVGDDGMLTITAWSKTEARLVKAIQELKSENDSLKSRIEALEG